jgi:hypothetical protein
MKLDGNEKSSLEMGRIFLWSRRESNLHQKFRKLLFYPLNYETGLSAKIAYSL